ncbi:MAG TPA: citrate synthase family protein [Myxococcaceae bacterium]|nr:citrate synthase family protein [Myxococcaceae bacterium]
MDNPYEALVDAREAARILGVKVATLYSYASRRWVRAFPSGRHREKRYLREDLETLRHRADARLGHEAVAAGALRWGEPVLSSALTEIRPDGPSYRGHSAVELASTVRFEAVAELLWAGTLPATPPVWSRPRSLPAAGLPRGPVDPLDALLAGLSGLRLARHRTRATATHPSRPRSRAGGLAARSSARRPVRAGHTGRALAEPGGPELVWTLVGLVAAACGHRPADALAAPDVASGVQRALGARARGARLIEATLVLCADHELNASSFAARVAASTGADLEACLLAALAAFSGPRHGAESMRVQALVAEADRPERARTTLLGRVRRGEALPGFGHRLYPSGDPRGALLLSLASQQPRPARALATLEALVSEAARLDLGEPTLDVGLLAVAHALQLPPWAGQVMFCVGRSAGWVAHVAEQRRSGELLRPRARYVGPRGPGPRW